MIGFSLAKGTAAVTELGTPIIFEVNLSGFGLNEIEDFNPQRVIAILEDGTMVRGELDMETGIFIFETTVMGNFTIAYVQTLRIIGLEIGSYDIMELIINERILVMDVTPIIQNNRTLIPLRFIADVLDATVYWHPEARAVTITRQGETLTFAIGEMAPGMDVPAQIVDNRTMVPLRFIAEFFDATVIWVEESREIVIIQRKVVNK